MCPNEESTGGYMKNGYHLLVLLASFGFSTESQAGPNDMYARGTGIEHEEAITSFDYNPLTVSKISGRVTKVDSYAKTTGLGDAVILNIQTKDGPMTAVLAPSWYLENQNASFKEGQFITVTGSQIKKEKTIFIIVAELATGNNKLELRDKTTGKPEWSEWRKNEEMFYKNYK